MLPKITKDDLSIQQNNSSRNGYNVTLCGTWVGWFERHNYKSYSYTTLKYGWPTDLAWESSLAELFDEIVDHLNEYLEKYDELINKVKEMKETDNVQID